jgi:hypothetical protein
MHEIEYCYFLYKTAHYKQEKKFPSFGEKIKARRLIVVVELSCIGLHNFFVFFLVLAVLGMEPRALSLLSKCPL